MVGNVRRAGERNFVNMLRISFASQIAKASAINIANYLLFIT